MNFDQFRFYELVLRRVAEQIYLGGGYQLDHYGNIVDKSLQLAESPQQVTASYAYNTHYGFDPSQYTLSGVIATALYDSRDSTINPSRGFYGILQLTLNPEFLGSSRSSTALHAEFRTYVPMSVEVPRDVLAFWVYVDGVVDGALPYLALPATGWGSRQRNGRGYAEGRFRGPWEAYAEVEWRFRITDNGLLGGVLFANAESFSSPGFTSTGYVSPSVKLLEYVQPAAGFGLRILVNRDSRTNLTLDFAFGQGSWGFWLNAGEYF
jgi:outer membrane protein assembly factor BamA